MKKRRWLRRARRIRRQNPHVTKHDARVLAQYICYLLEWDAWLKDHGSPRGLEPDHQIPWQDAR